jgi:hypothetical protein
VAFGMYMPRFNADVQKPKPRSKHHEDHRHHRQQEAQH